MFVYINLYSFKEEFYEFLSDYELCSCKNNNFIFRFAINFFIFDNIKHLHNCVEFGQNYIQSFQLFSNIV